MAGQRPQLCRFLRVLLRSSGSTGRVRTRRGFEEGTVVEDVEVVEDCKGAATATEAAVAVSTVSTEFVGGTAATAATGGTDSSV